MSMNDIKIFAKNNKERKTSIQTIGIFSQIMRMEFRIGDNEKWE